MTGYPEPATLEDAMYVISRMQMEFSAMELLVESLRNEAVQKDVRIASLERQLSLQARRPGMGQVTFPSPTGPTDAA